MTMLKKVTSFEVFQMFSFPSSDAKFNSMQTFQNSKTSQIWNNSGPKPLHLRDIQFITFWEGEERGAHYVAQASLKIAAILLPQLSKY